MQKDDLLPLVRQVLQGIAAMLVTRGAITASEVESVIGLGVSAFTIAWMLYSRRTARALAVAPAEKVREVLAEAGLVEPKK